MPKRELKQYGPKLETPFPVANPTQFAGLKAHISFDETEGTFVRDTVERRYALAFSPEPVVGPRGAALRVTVKPGQNVFGNGVEFGSTSHEGTQLGIGEGKPFTMAFWVRTEADKPQPLLLLHSEWALNPNESRSCQIGRDPKNGELMFLLTGTDETDQERFL